MSTPVDIGDFSNGDLLVWALAKVAIEISNRETSGTTIIWGSLFKGILRLVFD
jgi:hypothetical protein